MVKSHEFQFDRRILRLLGPTMDIQICQITKKSLLYCTVLTIYLPESLNPIIRSIVNEFEIISFLSEPLFAEDVPKSKGILRNQVDEKIVCGLCRGFLSFQPYSLG